MKSVRFPVKLDSTLGSLISMTRIGPSKSWEIDEWLKHYQNCDDTRRDVFTSTFWHPSPLTPVPPLKGIRGHI